MLYDDDDYYDGDDDYYDDEEYDEGGGGRGVVLALVAALVLVALGGVFVGILILSDMDKDDPDDVALGKDSPKDGTVKGDAAALVDDGGADLLEADGGLDLGFVDPDEELPAEEPPPREEPTPDTSWKDDSSGWEREERTTPAPTRTTREAPSQRRESESRTSRSAPPPREDPTPRQREEPTPRPRESRSTSSGDTRDPWDDNEDSGSGGSTVTVSSGGDEPAEENTPRPGSVVEDEPAPARGGGDGRTYEKESIASLGSSASDGKLDDSEIRFLQAIPSDHANYTLAWATVMKNAEAKRDYRDHCEASEKILTLNRNKYHPEWNLEMGKCHMRNGRWDQAVSSIDRTLTDSMGMTGSTKVSRLLTAYEVKAVSRTAMYDENAKANSGAGDEGKLAGAIQAWSEYRNYASGVGNQRALQKAEREIADLSARRDQ